MDIHQVYIHCRSFIIPSVPSFWYWGLCMPQVQSSFFPWPDPDHQHFSPGWRMAYTDHVGYQYAVFTSMADQAVQAESDVLCSYGLSWFHAWSCRNLEPCFMDDLFLGGYDPAFRTGICNIQTSETAFCRRSLIESEVSCGNLLSTQKNSKTATDCESERFTQKWG